LTTASGVVVAWCLRVYITPTSAAGSLPVASRKDIVPMLSSFARTAIVLGLLTAVGPFAIDMYLPALPAIAADLGASTAATQGSLMAFFLAVGTCQIIYGPISDTYGRKAPLYFGMALYTVGAIGCSLAPTVEWLIFARFVQGVGACAGMTIPRAIVRDLHTGPDAARLMSLIMLVFSVSPILAPLFGSTVIAFGSWRLIFLAVAVIGVLGLATSVFVLKETRPPDKRVPIDLTSVARGYLELLRDRSFLGVSMIGGFGLASFFAYLSASSFVYIEHFGLTPTQYGLAFSVNAIAFIGMAQLTGRLGRRFGLRPMVRAALAFYLAATAVLFGATFAGLDNVFALIVMLFVAFGSMGLVIPSTAVLALENYGPRAGTASALLGTIQLVAGAVVVGVMGTVSSTTPLPMVGVIFLCAAGAFALGRVALNGGEPVAQPAE
jgi:DHA1 family bicyclomycin/chloramphenicol resistance-like MFS transporter